MRSCQEWSKHTKEEVTGTRGTMMRDFQHLPLESWTANYDKEVKAHTIYVSTLQFSMSSHAHNLFDGFKHQFEGFKHQFEDSQGGRRFEATSARKRCALETYSLVSLWADNRR